MNSPFSSWCAKFRSPEPIANPFVKLAVNVNYNRAQGRGAGSIQLGQPTPPPPAVPIDLNAFHRNPNFQGRVGPTGVIGEAAYQRMLAQRNASPAAPAPVAPVPQPAPAPQPVVNPNDPAIAPQMAIGPEAAPTDIANPTSVAAAAAEPVTPAATAPAAQPTGPGMGRYWSDNLARTAVNAPANAWKAFADPRYNYSEDDSIVQNVGKTMGAVGSAGLELAKGLGAGMATIPAALLHDYPAAGFEYLNAPKSKLGDTVIGGLVGRGFEGAGFAGARTGPQPITGTPTASEIAAAPVGPGVRNQFAGLLRKPKQPPTAVVQNPPAPAPVKI